MKTVLFTGAGASRPLNYPTTVEFFPSDGSFDTEKQELFTNLKLQLEVETLDVEDALYILDKASEVLETPAGEFISRKLSNNWKNRINQFASYCQERCFHLYGRMPDESMVSKLYLPLLRTLEDAGSEGTSLFTGNYDPVTDAIMDIAESNKITSFDGFNIRGNWDPKGYALNNKGLNIYRIHGSMSWIKQGNRIKNTRDYSLRVAGRNDHLIIYPGFKGNPESKDAHEVYRYPHEKLREQLKVSDNLITIGFSFRDIHLNKIFMSSMEENPSLKIIILNPDWPDGLNGIMNEMKTKYKSRIHHLNKKFGDESVFTQLSILLNKT